MILLPKAYGFASLSHITEEFLKKIFKVAANSETGKLVANRGQQ
jgi:hypothetical protein